jgi:peptide chain release factor 1
MIFLKKLQAIEAKTREIEEKISDPSTMKDPNLFQKLNKELATLRPIVDAFEGYRQTDKQVSELESLIKDPASDKEMAALYQEEIKTLSEKRAGLTEKLEHLLLREQDPNANRDIIVEIRAGTGGEEAALFVADLFRMYTRYASRRGLHPEVISSSSTGIGGFKEVIFSVSGQAAYSFFKYESGIHRVQRVPATEAGGRIHTSAVTVAIMPEADETEVHLDPKDLRIDVFRASGAGGQHVNKTESAVRLTHLPTGLVVSCQDERSQHKNREKAMKVLMARLYDAQQQKQRDEMSKQRKEQVGSGDRSGKIRTYNFPDQRVTDHRIGLTLHALDDILDGYLDDLVKALEEDEKRRKLTDAA